MVCARVHSVLRYHIRALHCMLLLLRTRPSGDDGAFSDEGFDKFITRKSTKRVSDMLDGDGIRFVEDLCPHSHLYPRCYPLILSLNLRPSRQRAKY